MERRSDSGLFTRRYLRERACAVGDSGGTRTGELGQTPFLCSSSTMHWVCRGKHKEPQKLTTDFDFPSFAGALCFLPGHGFSCVFTTYTSNARDNMPCNCLILKQGMDFNQFKYLTAFTRRPLPFNYLGITNSKQLSWVKLMQTQTLTASPRRLRAI